MKLKLFGANAAGVAKPEAQFTVTSALRFSGAERIAVLAYGKTTRVSMQGDWPNPGFDGGFLPVDRSISSNGFTADWSVPFIARGVRAEGMGDSITGLDATALGVSFIELADPYQSVTRSLKYVLLFLGLLFLSYFVFEVTTGKRVHPAQYVLVGIAQIIFYLLLLSFSERIGFDFAFLIAGSATVILLSANAGWIFASRAQAFRALCVFALLYVLIYLLLRLEDNALLVGAITSFLAVTAAMYFTRSIDWYSSLPESTTASQ
jgi:inner membrane protein